ncbi:MAG: hypothetical protein ABI652_05305 [Acidobacteriota bacterium]
MSDLDAEIDRLYQTPLPEFTAARDALAKRDKASSAAIKKIEKPTAPAWAVNQLYWRRRTLVDRLVTAAEQLRAAHVDRMSSPHGERTRGAHSDRTPKKPVDVAAAEAAHRAALEAAVRGTRELLEEGGLAASPATLSAIGDTLQALPWSARDGRLTRPLKPLGFEVLAGMIRPGAAPPRRPADVVQISSATRRPKASDAGDHNAAERARREAEAQRREAAAREKATVEGKLREARTAAREAEAALARTQRALDDVAERRERLSAELEKAETEARRLQKEVNKETAAVEEAVADRERLERKLEELKL